MYKNSARFKKRNTYAFRAKETTVNAISVHNNTWNKSGRQNQVNLLYLGRISSSQIHLEQVSLCADPLFCLEFVEMASKSFNRRGFEKDRMQEGERSKKKLFVAKKLNL